MVTMYTLIKICCFIAFVQADYWSDRKKVIQDEREMALGSKIQLSTRENVVNKIIMKFKRKELEEGMKNPRKFSPAIHFFEARKEIENSSVFSLLKLMPKGAVLHTHDQSTSSVDWLVQNVTYRDHLYACVINGTWDFKFMESAKNNCWTSVRELRNQSSNITEFDNNLRSQLTLEVDNPDKVYKDINGIWKKFKDLYRLISPMLTYLPVYEDYLYETHKNMYKDKVIYFELRSSLLGLYSLNGTIIKPLEMVRIIENVCKRFIKDYPDFFGMKLIYSTNRQASHEKMNNDLDLYQSMKNLYPEIMAGFDISSQEDLGFPTANFVPELLKYKSTKLFLHAGETNWNGMFSDKDVIDAILLNTTRIGHGYALLHHPKALKEIKKRDIAIEVNPISNQVLMLVKDLRNHPGNFFIAEGYPVVISGDNNGFWGASSLNHDFYVTFMSLANADDDLRLLKQLAYNSIKYSALSNKDKTNLMKMWEKSWNSFINTIVEQNVNLYLSN